MYTIKEKDVPKINLPGRTCQVMVGSNNLIAENITFGIAKVPPFEKMSPHMHEKEEEVIYIIKGYGYVVVNKKKEVVEPGSTIFLPKGSEHFIHNQSADTMKFIFAFSPPVKVGAYDQKQM